MTTIEEKIKELKIRHLDINNLKCDINFLLTCNLNEKSKNFLYGLMEDQIAILSQKQLKWMANLLLWNKPIDCSIDKPIDKPIIRSMFNDWTPIDRSRWNSIRKRSKIQFMERNEIYSTSNNKEWRRQNTKSLNIFKRENNLK